VVFEGALDFYDIAVGGIGVWIKEMVVVLNVFERMGHDYRSALLEIPKFEC
jgi:hypothetical protein